MYQLEDILAELHSIAEFAKTKSTDVHNHDFDPDKILRWMRVVTSEVESLLKLERQLEEDVESTIKNQIIGYTEQYIANTERYQHVVWQKLKSQETSFVLSEVWKNLKTISKILTTEKESRSYIQKQEVIDEHNFETSAAQVSFDEEEKQG